jgi:hypothetical protein
VGRQRKATPSTGPASPLSARQEAMWAWWCCTPTSSTSGRSTAYLVDRHSGCRSCATTCGRMPNSRPKCEMCGTPVDEQLVADYAFFEDYVVPTCVLRRAAVRLAPRWSSWEVFDPDRPTGCKNFLRG